MKIKDILTKKTLRGLSVFYFLITIPLFLLASVVGARNNNVTFGHHVIKMWWVFLIVPLGLIAFHVCILTLSTLVNNDR